MINRGTYRPIRFEDIVMLMIDRSTPHPPTPSPPTPSLPTPSLPTCVNEVMQACRFTNLLRFGFATAPPASSLVAAPSCSFLPPLLPLVIFLVRPTPSPSPSEACQVFPCEIGEQGWRLGRVLWEYQYQRTTITAMRMTMTITLLSLITITIKTKSITLMMTMLIGQQDRERLRLRRRCRRWWSWSWSW